jgi:hypothetical protein
MEDPTWAANAAHATIIAKLATFSMLILRIAPDGEHRVLGFVAWDDAADRVPSAGAGYAPICSHIGIRSIVASLDAGCVAAAISV